MRSGEDVHRLILDYCRPSKVFDRNEREACRKLAEVIKAYMRNKFDEFLKDSANEPILYTYGSDGTDLVAQHTVTGTVAGGRKFHRRSGRTLEFLLEKGWAMRHIGNRGCLATAEAPTTV